ncbi:MAG: polysaccharide deacetylase family protein [Candidatus Omnitrophica bacterium]|nr:polysaccharide deacetylase family protein [Candidatus Omnitrophota bacterium]
MKKKHLCIMYHSVGTENINEIGAQLYSVTAENFRKQMEYISLRLKAKTQNSTLNEDKCNITFDDGISDNYTIAYPVLKQLGLKAYFFILVGKVGKDGYMNWEQIRGLKDAGMIVGSHGMTHRILTELDDKELEYELYTSKEILEDRLATRIDYLSLPRGFYNKKIIDMAKIAGYKAVFSSQPDNEDGFIIGRIAVRSNWDIDKFKNVIENGLPWQDKITAGIKRSLSTIVGTKIYDRLRNIVLTRNQING